jgi:hypothetical protein
MGKFNRISSKDTFNRLLHELVFHIIVYLKVMSAINNHFQL